MPSGILCTATAAATAMPTFAESSAEMNVAIPSGKLDGDSQRRHYPHASQPMGMFRIRDSPNLLDAVQLVRILGIRDELVDKPGDEDTSEKSEGGYQTAPCRTFRDDFELLT